jgi:hypothetical protein
VVVADVKTNTCPDEIVKKQRPCHITVLAQMPDYNDFAEAFSGSHRDDI